METGGLKGPLLPTCVVLGPAEAEGWALTAVGHLGISGISAPNVNYLEFARPPLRFVFVLISRGKMPSIANTVYYAFVVAWGSATYQLVLKDLFTTTFGVGRVIQTIDEFPYTCRHIEHPRLEACEDIWLDNDARTLYAACAGTQGRLAWNQA
jgi:hypothetical protein